MIEVYVKGKEEIWRVNSTEGLLFYFFCGNLRLSILLFNTIDYNILDTFGLSDDFVSETLF